jgi:pyridoxamine 5'-phosphate oxidase
MTNSISNLRISYETDGLRRRELAADPFSQFGLWLQQAIDSGGILESNAMTLATATEDGFPSARTVLLKEFNEAGFVFFTNYDSQKAHELAENPHAALLFHWGELHRQVRLVGTVAKVSVAESEAYFHSRPLGSQLGAWASRQSEVIANRDVLAAELARVTELYQGQTIPLPLHWGGYRLSPKTVEFWQGRPDRLHDRFRYSRQANNSWLIERLSP